LQPPVTFPLLRCNPGGGGVSGTNDATVNTGPVGRARLAIARAFFAFGLLFGVTMRLHLDPAVLGGGDHR